jgi:hypothetical protein
MSKFSGAYAEELDESVCEGFGDDVIGSVDELGHYALFIDYTTKTGEMIHAILYTDSDGFVDSTLYDTAVEARKDWKEIEQQYTEYDCDCEYCEQNNEED